MSLRAQLVVCALLLVGGEVKADPIVIGQVDTFQAGPQGWHVGGGGPYKRELRQTQSVLLYVPT